MKAAQFRKLLKSKKPVVLSGAHDALSAKLTEEAGFDAVWVSSFGVSASLRCMPDANVLTMTEMLDAAKSINDAVKIPVIADCDNGYGGVHNIIRMVREYERADIAGISIEDNPFPKKCSLYPGERPELVNADEMAGRIQAARKTRKHREFFIIARTEALIAGLGMEEAMERALKYEKAGADAILIHSRKKTADEIRAFCRLWKKKGRIPLVAVPTKYPGITTGDLARMGIRVVIFANHALRASVSAMRKTLSDIRKSNSVANADKNVARLSEIFKLVGQPQMEENEDLYLTRYKDRRPAIIVAAGFDEKLWPLNADRPKAMLRIKGKSILERQIETLRQAGINDIAVIGGYRAEAIDLPGIRYFVNPKFRQTHMLHTLFCAEEMMHSGFIFVYGDVLFDRYILDKLLKSKKDITMAVDCFADPTSANGSAHERDWARLSSARTPAAGTRPQDRVVNIGRQISPAEATGEFIGLASFTTAGARAFRKNYHRLRLSNNAGRAFHAAKNWKTSQFTDLIQEMISKKHLVHSTNIRGGWIDIDTFEDYKKAWERVSG